MPRKLIARCGASILATLLFAQTAPAEVIEIGGGGEITVLDRARALRVGPPFAPRPIASGLHASSGIADQLRLAADRYEIDPALLNAVAWNESRYSEAARSAKGAIGVMQLMDATARHLGVDRFDTSQNILGGAAYLKQMLIRYRGDITLALAAYNAGPGAVDRYGAIPPFPETRNYIHKIMGTPLAAIHSAPPSVIFIDP
jgi:soluble lytic murein transglycosylase-like protein